MPLYGEIRLTGHPTKAQYARFPALNLQEAPVILPDDVLDAATRVAIAADEGGKDGIVALYAETGLDETVVAHMIAHAVRLGVHVDSGSLAIGALLALLTVGHADDGAGRITDHDIQELLRPR